MQFGRNDDNGGRFSGGPQAKKKFGQHFLTDGNMIRKIVSAAEIREGDRVVEVGPGTGALTEALLDAGALVTAVEVDTGLAGMLEDKFAGSEGFRLIVGDALKVSYTGLAQEAGCRLKVVSNLPYNISGPILARFIDQRAAFTLLVLMFQKEVAVRIASQPGTKDYGVLSVLSQVYMDVKLEFGVSRNLFRPRPKVDSSVVSLRVLPSPRVEVLDPAFFATVVKSAFGQRRKTLSNALKTLGLDHGRVLGALAEAGIDPKRRGETLTLEEFSRLAALLGALRT